MGLLDRLLGRTDHTAQADRQPPAWSGGAAPDRAAADRAAADRAAADRAAVARYRYLLRTAPPEAIEQAHAEAFAQLTPDQRRQVLASLGQEGPGTDWARSYDPHSLARIATRAELRRPGTLERSFSRGLPGFGGGVGMGGMGGMGGVLAGSLLASVAGAFIGTAVADALLPDDFGAFDQDALGGDGFDGGFSTDPDDFDGDLGGDLDGDLGGDFGEF